MPENESPTITLPYDENLIIRLELKLQEYKKRYEIHRAPELQMDTIFKIVILEKLLLEWEVRTWDIAREWVKNNPSLCDGDAFNNACGVIRGYAENGGENLVGGTGLPKLPD